jgi:hypothetical protein
MANFNAAMLFPKIQCLVGSLARKHKYHHHNIVDIEMQLQIFRELEEMSSSANRVTAEKTACELHFIDSNHQTEDEKHTVNQSMKLRINLLQSSHYDCVPTTNQTQGQLLSKNVIHQLPQL